MKTIYYYQTFKGLDKCFTHPQDIDNIIISSIHFGNNNIYLNDNLPDDKIFYDLWTQTEKLSYQNTTIMIMVGGAGGAYTEMFKNFDHYYQLLKNLINKKSWIKGIDLDIEEPVDIDNIKLLINHLVQDFGEDFIITMAPVSSTLIHDGSSFAGFNYKDLYNSKEGKYIHWFNTQCYYSFSFETFESIIKNNYPSHKIVIGMESGQFNESDFNNALKELKKIKNKYPDFKGVYDWEYFNAPPNNNDPSEWSRLIKSI